jgi:hypothetical protein
MARAFHARVAPPTRRYSLWDSVEIGFTGTPIELQGTNTRAVFGD